MSRFTFSSAALLFLFMMLRSAHAQDALVGAPVKRFGAATTTVTGTTATDTGSGTTNASYQVTRADDNFRLALKRWSKQSGWEFEPEHWAVPRDIPINGSADFGADFREAVRALLKSSELSDLPVQGCFYSNRVLRVIPINELCARSATSN